MSENDLEIVRYDGEFDSVLAGLAQLKPFEFIDEPTVVCDLSSIISRVRLWKEKMPRITLYYPVKCNNDPVVLRILDRVGVKFSCVSKDEIRETRLNGVIADDILFANPVKIISHLRCAEKQQVKLLVVDSLDELEKVKIYHPNARVMLKIKFNSQESSASGCDPKTDALKLMMEAKNMDLNMCGISFDNDSHLFDTEAYKTMLVTTRSLFDYGKGILGLALDTVSIGGGLPANMDSESFAHFSAVINKIIDEFFPEQSISVIAEPGEFLIGPSMTLFCVVQARKEILTRDGDLEQMIYYVNHSSEGKAVTNNLHPKIIEAETHDDNGAYKSVIRGSTNEADDIVCPATDLPLQFVGDVLYFDNVGTSLRNTKYGGFRAPSVKYFLKKSCKIIL